MPAIVGYARVSTSDQDLAGQKHRLQAAGARRVFEDVTSGKSLERPGLAELLNYLRPGDTLAAVRLDRLGRSLRELLDIVEALNKREKSSTPRRLPVSWSSMSSAPSRSSNGASSPSAPATV